MNIKKSSNSGFTLIEIIVVMLILGTMLSLVATNLGSLVPSSRIYASSRSIDSNISLALSHAVVSGHPTVLRYDLDNNYHQVFIFDKKEKNSYKGLDKKYLSSGVRYQNIHIAGDRKYVRGWVEIQISPLSTISGHAVHLKDEDNREVTLIVNPLTGIVDTKEGYQGMKFLEKP